MRAPLGEMEALPEADCAPGAPHPRFTSALFGQSDAEARFLEAFDTGRLHHAWLISGPKGIGKATLAWRIAKFLLSQPKANDGGLFGDAPPAPTSLDTDPENPIARRAVQLAESRLCLVRRTFDEKKGKFSAGISVEEVRKLNAFFHMSAADGGRRVVIVDAADEMNVSAANALLKTLEEPPEDAFLLLICHQPARLLPTIRSRCRSLRLGPLGPENLALALDQAGFDAADHSDALAELSAGSVGEALRLTHLDGVDAYGELVGLFSSLPRLDRPRALALAESCVGAANQERLDLVLGLIDRFLSRLARTGAGHPPIIEAARGEAALLQKLAPHSAAARDWAQLSQDISARAAHARAVNLDPAALILDIVFKINETASKAVS